MEQKSSGQLMHKMRSIYWFDILRFLNYFSKATSRLKKEIPKQTKIWYLEFKKCLYVEGSELKIFILNKKAYLSTETRFIEICTVMEELGTFWDGHNVG